MGIFVVGLGTSPFGRPKFIYYLLMVSTTAFLVNILKMLYKHDRPLWLNPEIASSETTQCSENFANPSGHAMIASALAFTILCDAIEHSRGY